MLKKQKFGVEIELTGITRNEAAKTIAEILNSTASRHDNTCYKTQTIIDSKNRLWKVMRDSSINPTHNDEYRVEIVTPPLDYDDIELLQTVIRAIKKAGGKTNSSCGIHIHIDGKNHNAQSIKRLVNFVTERQDLIYEALNITNGRSNQWCKKLSPKLLEELKKCSNPSKQGIESLWYSQINNNYCGGIDHSHYNYTRYHGINLHSYFSKGTVEFRLFNSTLHAGKIKAYIQFCLAMSAWSIESTGRVIFHSMIGYTPEQKVTIMRNVLVKRLDLAGDEFKTCRYHLLKHLKDSNTNMTIVA